MAKKTKGSLSEFFYRLRYRVGEYCLSGFIRLLPWIPARPITLFTSLAEGTTFRLLWRYRRRMEENLAMAMGKEIPSAEERNSLVRRAWRNFAQGVLETGRAMHLSRQEILSQVAIEGEEHLQRALEKGKGVIALSAHLGNFTMIGCRLAAAGYPFSAVVKQPRDKRFARLIDGYRERVGIKTISAKPRREAVRGILKALRENRIVLVIADEFKSGGLEVDFFGRNHPAPRGPATLALRTGAATLPMFATRDSQDRLTLRIGPEIELVRAEELEDSVAATTALFTGRLEAMIRRYPDQWNWLGFYRNGRVPRSEIGKASLSALDPKERVPS